MKHLRILSLAGLVVCLGCGGSGPAKMKRTAEQAPRPAADQAPQAPAAGQLAMLEQQNKPGQPAPDAKPPLQRKIKHTAEIGLIVEDFSKADEQLLDLVEVHKGYVARSDIVASSGSVKQGTWRLRIPLDHFNAFCKEIKNLGEVEKNSRDSQDVTEEYYDLESYIKTRETELESLRELMKKETNNRETFLAYRREINEVQVDINKNQGRFKLLANLTDFTTVTVTMREKQKYILDKPPEIAEVPTFGTRAAKTFEGSLDILKGVAQNVALVFIALGPWLPILAIVGAPVWFLVRHWRRQAPFAVVVMGEQSSTPPPASS